MTCHVVLRSILALHQHAYLMSHIMFISVYPWLCNYAQVMTHEFVLVFLSLPFAPLHHKIGKYTYAYVVTACGTLPITIKPCQLWLAPKVAFAFVVNFV